MPRGAYYLQNCALPSYSDAMKKILSLCIIIFLIFPTPAAAKFSDVKGDNPYASDITKLESNGIIIGDTFGPDELVKRGEFASWLLKYSGFNQEYYETKTKRRFGDVKLNAHPLSAYVYRLVEIGAVKEPSSKYPSFKPDDPISFKEALELTFFVQGVPVPKIFDTTQFNALDINVKSKIAPLIHTAMVRGVIPAGIVKPYKKTTRAEAAHIIVASKSSTPGLTVTILGTQIGGSASNDITQNPRFDTLSQAWNRILGNYLRRDDIQKEQLIYGAITGMVKELGDKHSSFERPGDNAVVDSLSGQVEGIGAVIQEKDDFVIIVTPIVGSPAEKAGLLPKDVILKVNDVEVKGKKATEVANLIKGKKGTQVTLTIQRGGTGTTPLTFTITRDVVKIISADLKRTNDNVATIQLVNFGEKTSKEFLEVVKQLQTSKPRGIILDLRNNPGGYLDTAIDIAGYFIKSEQNVSIVKYHDREEEQKSHGKTELAGIPLVIIVNNGSASASEILAGALQDYGLAKIVGEQSYGKGTVQELSNFNDGSTIKLTVAEWLTPNRRSIEKNGITPDVVVKLTDEDRKAGRDPQMERALLELQLR